MINLESIIHVVNVFDNYHEDVVKILPEKIIEESDGVIFLKPEICSLVSENLYLVLSYFESLTKKHHIEIQNTFVVSGSFIIKNNIYAENYKNIREYACYNFLLHEVIYPKLSKIKEFKNCQLVIGGIALTEKGYSPEFVLDLWLNSGKVLKVDDDFYGISCLLEGKEILLVNGFYPAQIEQYNIPASKIILFSFQTKKSFTFLKKYFQGTVELHGRDQESMRQYFYENRYKYQLDSFSSSRNGIHLSGNRESYTKLL